jgi:hypothetical protein
METRSLSDLRSGGIVERRWPEDWIATTRKAAFFPESLRKFKKALSMKTGYFVDPDVEDPVFLKKSYSRTVNDDNMLKINKAVRDAGETGREIDALKALDEIPEIGLPVASAILTVCYPHKFTILDIRLLGILALYPSRLERNKPSKPADDQWTAEDYWNEFAPTVQ